MYSVNQSVGLTVFGVLYNYYREMENLRISEKTSKKSNTTYTVSKNVNFTKVAKADFGSWADKTIRSENSRLTMAVRCFRNFSVA